MQVARALSRFGDRHFDPAFGTDTRGVIETADQTDVTSRNRARGIRYEPTRAVPFRRVMRAARIPAEGTFVDLGCGKGRVLMLAALHGFPRVVGIDYSPALCAAAQRNLDILRARTGRSFRSTLLAMDATDYAFTPEDRVIFLFNPFDATVLAVVLARLHASWAAHPRRVWLIYHYPIWKETLDRQEWLERAGTWTLGGAEFAVYVTRG